MDGLTSIPAYDGHLHAAPSSTQRWGTDLELVDAARRSGIRGFVLKSHHESTASRAAIAREFARRQGASCEVLGAIALNPWISAVELKRALHLGAKVVWWPTRDDAGRHGPFGLPELHEQALTTLAAYPDVVIGTGHLHLGAAKALVRRVKELGCTVVVTHPLNPDVGVGVAGALELANLGAAVEVDALALRLLRQRGVDSLDRIRKLVDGGARVFGVSDGGQRVNGDPFCFMRAEFDRLRDAGGAAIVDALVAGSDRMWKGRRADG